MELGPIALRAVSERHGLPIDRIYFPTKSSQIPNRAALTIVVLPPENGDIEETKTLQLVDSMTKQSGTSDRTFKSALIWCVPDSGRQLCDEARKLLAWEDIQEEAAELKLEDLQRKQGSSPKSVISVRLAAAAERSSDRWLQ